MLRRIRDIQHVLETFGALADNKENFEKMRENQLEFVQSQLAMPLDAGEAEEAMQLIANGPWTQLQKQTLLNAVTLQGGTRTTVGTNAKTQQLLHMESYLTKTLHDFITDMSLPIKSSLEMYVQFLVTKLELTNPTEKTIQHLASFFFLLAMPLDDAMNMSPAQKLAVSRDLKKLIVCLAKHAEYSAKVAQYPNTAAE